MELDSYRPSFYLENSLRIWAIIIVLRRLKTSHTLMYVDDVIGVGMAGVIEEDIHRYARTCDMM
jgi:hypothetical protein